LAADQADAVDRKPEVFRSVTAVIIWWVWLLFAAANLIDLAVQGRDHLSVVAGAILLFITGVAYVTAQRPRVEARADALTVRNPLRDHAIPWPNVVRADLSDLLRIKYRVSGDSERAVSAWAIHYSRRKQFVSETKSRRANGRGARPARAGGFGSFGVSSQYRPTSTAKTPDPVSAEAQAERAITFINEYAASIPGDQPYGAVVSAWNWKAIAALVLPALLLLVVALV
jgi:hypothetical protein